MNKRKGKKGFLKFLLETTSIGMINFLQHHVVDQVAHEAFKKVLTKYLKDITKVVLLITDSTSDNTSQLEWLWDTQIKGSAQDETLDVARYIINIKIKDPIIQETLIAILDSYEEKYHIP